jgi:cardiolipin synthase
MGAYRTADLLLIPNLISLLRLPLAWAFSHFAGQPAAALTILVLAGLSDVLDGFWARHYRQATATGAVVDGVTDKVFAMTVAVVLVHSSKLTWLGALALATREVLELPLVLWWATHRAQRKARAEDPKANVLGKLVTTLQFAAVAALLFNMRWHRPLLILTAAGGVIAAVSYWRRELRATIKRKG